MKHLNEQQIKANFESQSTVLNRVKKGFEAAQKFVDETVCRLRYGTMFVSAKINYGTEFYLSDATQLRERYKMAKESGASEGNWMRYKIRLSKRSTDTTQYKCNVC